jgi:hypothetical protein
LNAAGAVFTKPVWERELALDANFVAAVFQPFRGPVCVAAAVKMTVAAEAFTRVSAVKHVVRALVVVVLVILVAGRLVGLGCRRCRERQGRTDNQNRGQDKT